MECWLQVDNGLQPIGSLVNVSTWTIQLLSKSAPTRGFYASKFIAVRHFLKALLSIRQRSTLTIVLCYISTYKLRPVATPVLTILFLYRLGYASIKVSILNVYSEVKRKSEALLQF